MATLPLLALPAVAVSANSENGEGSEADFDEELSPASLLELFNETPDVTVKTVEAPHGTYIVVGEDHYTDNSLSKLQLAKRIRELATTGRIDLTIEADGESSRLRGEALDRLMESAGWPPSGDSDANGLPDGLDYSLLYNLNDLVPEFATPFVSRPEYLDDSMLVDPEELLIVAQMADICIDLRTARAVTAIRATVQLAINTLGSALFVAERLVREERIDSKLIPIVLKTLKKPLLRMRKAAGVKEARPLISSVVDAVLNTTAGKSGEFIDALTDCMFAPHVVTDAKLATDLMRKGPHSKPVVVVGGQAHADALTLMLSSVDVR